MQYYQGCQDNQGSRLSRLSIILRIKKISRLSRAHLGYQDNHCTEAKKAFAFCMLESFYALSPQSQMYMQIIIINSWWLFLRNCDFKFSIKETECCLYEFSKAEENRALARFSGAFYKF